LRSIFRRGSIGSSLADGPPGPLLQGGAVHRFIGWCILTHRTIMLVKQ
jgi:hypothetical protein